MDVFCPRVRLSSCNAPSRVLLHRSRSSSRRALTCRADKVHTVTLVLPGGREAVFRAGSSKSIYDIASYAGVHLPASCRMGTCTSCVCKLLAGHVKQPQQSCLPPPLLKQGYVAICCATPTSDVTLLTHQGAAVRKWKAEQPAKGK